LVINTSSTRAAAVDGLHPDLGPVVVHFSTFLDDDREGGARGSGGAHDSSEAGGSVAGGGSVASGGGEAGGGSWVVEIRTAPLADKPVRISAPGARIQLADGVILTLVEPHPASTAAHTAGQRLAESVDWAGELPRRLWRTQRLGSQTIQRLFERHGRPIRYGYLSGEWPLEAYQTIFAGGEGGSAWGGMQGSAGGGAQGSAGGGARGSAAASAEMPSAGRPFSPGLVTRLVSQGVLFAPITLHAGVSSPEHGEPPAAERYRVPARTAMLTNWIRQVGGRVIAVGTTVTRALESAADVDGTVAPADGWTDLVLGPDRPVRVVNGLITGLHDPDASHLLLLEAVAGADLVQQTYNAALDRRYLWHEFGDTCLLIPG
jgi:S-adenosylmethionine:tRNA ribosyltransferase-isomerase